MKYLKLFETFITDKEVNRKTGYLSQEDITYFEELRNNNIHNNIKDFHISKDGIKIVVILEPHKILDTICVEKVNIKNNIYYHISMYLSGKFEEFFTDNFTEIVNSIKEGMPSLI